MPWKIQWTHQALKDLDGLETRAAQRIIKKLERAAADPVRIFHRLVGCDDYKLRIGDYRLLAMLSHAAKTIIVERVGHRSRVYKQ